MRKILISGLILALLCGGCIGVGTETTQEVTVGQELIDLKRALDSGAISEQEYVKLKQKTLEKKQ